MVSFTKIRVSGFKSFVEPTELVIEAGLTGVVGPNGCGKSNLLEALRWAMGEGSARQLRGDEMDDVIFGGTADRPARNIAEVVIYLDNQRRNAPAPFNDHEEIEVSRRIERGSGSVFRINGREARARDVQLLFADLSTGARSTAIVSQGRVASLIAAKPVNRRVLLEEAAGITGLHSRRHEAELRLGAAENNLARLEDVVTALADQLQGLKRQARQASRYRNLSDHIRRAEAVLLHLRWGDASAELAAAEGRLRAADAKVREHTEQAAKAGREQAEAGAALPDLRRAEGQAAAELQRLVLARDTLAEEERRLKAARQEIEVRLAQIADDERREVQLVGDSQSALERLDEEEKSLNQAQASEAEARAAAADQLGAATAELTGLEFEATELTEKVASDEARRAGLAQQIAELEGRHERLERRLEEASDELAELAAAPDGDPAAADTTLADTEPRLDEARREADEAEAARSEAESALEVARAALHDAEAEATKRGAEAEAIMALMGGEEAGRWTPVLDAIEVEAGYEIALGAALGDDLTAPTDTAAAMHWGKPASAGAPPPLPPGIESLDRYVKAPSALAPRLAQIGVVADEKAGRTAAGRLAPGQRLVTREGAMWRWDGFTAAAGADTAAATRLEHKKRLVELHAALAGAKDRVDALSQRHGSAAAEAASAGEREKRARDTLRQIFLEGNEARETLAEAEREAATRAARRETLEESVERLNTDLGEIAAELDRARDAGGDMAAAEGDRGRLDEQRARVTSVRESVAERRQASDRLTAEAEARRNRLAAIAEERQSWRARRENLERQMTQLGDRRAVAEGELQRLAARPDEISRERVGLLSAIDAADAKRTAEADKLVAAETGLGEIDARLKKVEAALADAREERGRCEGTVKQTEQARETVAERIRERLDCPPDRVLDVAEIKDRDDLPDLAATETRLERLVRERENMGPVNLRAEAEAEELAEQIESLEVERKDLTTAIARFRKAIAELNREGRERLLASFEKVDKHFQDLFVRLYGGGRAHLKLTESDDPLEAGLEIMASPPGKRLQALSLLSGGEQALTALALLFAVFLTNPAPICILDEVDASLDDANVDRFCTLMEDINRTSETRFLLITHHRMTMARMDRLFGVTMPERGVSQLVSVDLRRAEALRDTA